ncbi:unnamed protein product [Amaranthus hypochondriacus]
MSSPIYVTAAFRSGHKNQAYIFMKKEYIIEDVNPGSYNDIILYGPAKVNQYSSLKGTVFGDKGIDCAFPSEQEGVAFIFSGNLCAKWSYGLKNPENKLLVGPSPIDEVFPYLKGTIFANGLDAAFETSRPYEVYLFKGDKYARINYEGAGKLLNSSPIRQNWVSLRGTIFENGIDGAFSLDHDTYPNSVYLFKGDTYARVTYTPGTATEKLNNLAKIKSYWTGLGSILPRFE